MAPAVPPSSDVVAPEQPALRRGLFSRRRPADQPAPVPVAVPEPPPVAEPEPDPAVDPAGGPSADAWRRAWGLPGGTDEPTEGQR
jgi:hypothetical protein